MRRGGVQVIRSSAPQGSMILCHQDAHYVPSYMNTPVQQLSVGLREGAIGCGLRIPRRKPGPRPNTNVEFLLYDVMSFPAAKSPLNERVWEELLRSDPGDLGKDIQGMIRYGAKIGYEGEKLRFRSRRLEENLPMDAGAERHVEQEIRNRVAKGAVRPLKNHEHVVCSPLGAVPKPEVNGVKMYRTIHHLSWPRRGRWEVSVNEGINSAWVTLRYFSLDELLRELGKQSREDPGNRRGRVLWKVDLKDAYRHVVVEENDSRLLGFFWPGVGYACETQLSFGGKSAPFLFNLIAEGFEWILESLGVDCHHYLDDTFGWTAPPVDVTKLLSFVDRVAKSLGLSTAAHKTLSGTELEILGITIDCTKGVAFISERKLDRIRAELDAVERSVDVIQIQSLVGSLVFVTRVCVAGKAFLRRLFDQVTICMNSSFGRRRLTQDAKREVLWWKSTLQGYNALRYLSDDPDLLPRIEVWSDASGLNGIGGHLEGAEQFSERIAAKHMGKDIMFKEALAVLTCVDKWKTRFHRRLVILHVDNQALVAAINKGGCRQRSTQALIRRLYTLAAHHSFSLRSEWLPSEANGRADRLSRFTLGTTSSASAGKQYIGDFDPDLQTDDVLGLDNDFANDDWIVSQDWPLWSFQ